MVSAVNDWHTYLDDGMDVFFVLKKTFDSVPHIALLNQLVNLNPYLYRWIAIAVRGPKLWVSTARHLQPYQSFSQGSVLGPLLFL